MSKRIGLFSGTFDPIHVGHVEACLVALGACDLDKVLVMIEKTPTRKTNVTSYDHRKKMVQLALQDFRSINFFEHLQQNITFANMLPRVQETFPKATICLIIGSDMLGHLNDWPDAKKWLPKLELCVVLRSNKDKSKVSKQLESIPAKSTKILPAVWSEVSSSTIKAEMLSKNHSDNVHQDVLAYIAKNHLYQPKS